MDFEEFCAKVLQIDPKIRFFAVYQNGKFSSKMQSGVKNYMTQKETEASILESLNRWESRSQLEEKVGKTVFTLSKYEKIFRITLPLNNGLVLATTELDADVFKIISEIEEIKNQFEWLYNIIVADDNKEMIEPLSILLGQKSIRTISKAYNGKEAVDLYFAYKPDVILIDIKMPEYDGLYAIKEIKKKDPNAKIIILTAYSNEIEDKSIGDIPIFIKPIEINELVETIHKLATTNR